MDKNQQEVDLSLVVDAVKRASDRELAVLSEISRKLDGKTLPTNQKKAVLAVDTKGIEKAVTKGVSNASFNVSAIPSNNPQKGLKSQTSETPKSSSTKTKRTGEIELSFAPSQPAETQAKPDAKAVEQNSSVSAVTPIADTLKNEVAREPVKQAPVVVNVEAPESNSERLDTSILDDVPEKLEKAVSDALAEFEGYWEDANGKLRRSDGRYASKQEQSAYKNAQQTALERQIEKQTDTEKESQNVFAKVATSLKQLAINNVKEFLQEENDATDAAGAAAGGSFFYSAKELYHLGQDAKNALDDVTEKATSTKDKLKESKLGRLFTRGKKAPEADSQAVTAIETISHEQLSATKDSFETSHSTQITPSDRPNRDGARGNVSVNRGGVDSSRISTASEIKNTKEQTYRANMLEVLHESSADRERQFDDVLDKLDDLISATKAAANDGQGGLLDLAGDMFERRRGRAGGRAGRKAGGKRGRIKSVMSGIGSKASNVASKGVSMAGAAFKGMSKIGSVAGKAIPFLAPALMAYDAFSGFTDKDKQKETFNLKDGQEATTGQKSSMALANVLDLGGLVSGGAGLLGSALGAFGFDGAKEALTFDSGDLAKGIYKLFGGEIEGDKKAEPEKEEHLKSAEAYHTAKASGDEKAMRELDAKNSNQVTSQEVAQKANEQGISYKEAYLAVKSEKQDSQDKRVKVAKETGMDMSGMVEHPDLGQVYSPEKKAEQVAAVDAEIKRRKEAEAVAALTKAADNTQTNSVTTASHESSINTELSKQKTDTQSVVKVDTENTSNKTVATQSSIQRNERVSELQAQAAMKDLKESGKPQTVELSKHSLDAIGRAVNGSDATKPTTIFAAPSGGSSKDKPASSTKASGSIPLNFDDRSLQRQSADME
ncbi:TPA: hypothetical protein ACMDSS_003714 [Vibrio parahaemolyticus]|uniref:hypothetical protein n=1 Tax=Vibrio parahaemolyticus TaxID=670 RepID=UPI001D168D1A|nr:hypothetical protein [Vibrio parahaemolyticus]EGR0375086.1 hypothetical protein [Vibrio parahaemolyticus]EGR0913745.1 hypothetical protein [Vibrio parahaemolyticus]EGR3207747.1 hypothetical protein [Vibrio parahaemolyticus]EID7761409.1 hypothetical protein [Vibrio parahaemolyticus]EJD0685849.1 hypothetical protein [Vibrio parahaemolyticus]